MEMAGGKPFSQSYFRMGQSAVQHSVDVQNQIQSQPSFLTLKPTNYQSDNSEENGAYSWGYKWTDEFGNQMFREETADGRGTVRGRYSYREANVSALD